MSDAFDPYYKWIGIPPNEQPPDHYRLLGIALFECDTEVISHAADQRMAHLKNFQTGRHSALSQRLLNEVAAAKLVLLSPPQKATYDRQLRGRIGTAGFSLAGWLDPGRPFWQRLGTAAAAVVLCVAAITFLLARRDSDEALPTRRGRQATGDSSALAKRPHSADCRSPNATRSDVGTPAAELDPVLPATSSAPKATEREQARIPVSAAAVQPQDRQPQQRSPGADPIRPRAAEAREASRIVYLDDLEEIDSRVACGSLGKHGATGYLKQELEYGKRAVFRGSVCSHALSLHPPSKGASYVAYNLGREFRTFRVTAAILDVGKANAAALQANPLFMGKAYTPLIFKVFGDGQLLWQSRPIEKSGHWQDCSIGVEGVNLLELQVHCPGTNAFAWAAWVDPRLSK